MRQIMHKLGFTDIGSNPIIRSLTIAWLVSSFGNGLFTTVEVIYFTFVVGLPPHQVALALGISGVASLVLSVPLGHFADRFGAKRVAVFSEIIHGFLLVGMAFVHTYWPFLFLNVVIVIFGTLGHIAQSALTAKLGEGEERVKIRAIQRTMANVGIGLGTLFAGFALAANTVFGYQLMLFLNCGAFLVSAYLVSKLPTDPATVEKSEPFSFVALKDKKYLAATLINAVMTTHFVLQNVAIPLWVVRETEAPRWWMSVLFIINTAFVAIFQIRASQGTGDLATSARKFRNSGYWLFLACVVYGLAAGTPIWIACVVLVAAMLLHIAGEVLHAAGSWAISFDLADEKHQGQYQGVYSMSWGISGSIGPSFVTFMALELGLLGWAIMGAMFAVAGWLMHRLVTRP